MRRLIYIVLIAVGLLASVIWWSHLRNEFFILLGNRDEAGAWYGLWSGFGGALPDVLILTGMIAWYRKQNCEVRRCPWLARHQTAAGHHVCRGHSPHGAPSHQDVLDAHAAAQRQRCG